MKPSIDVVTKAMRLRGEHAMTGWLTKGMKLRLVALIALAVALLK